MLPRRRSHLSLKTALLAFVSFSCGAAVTPLAAQTVRSLPPGGDLQAALNAAQPGDTIVLAAGATYVGNFTLPVKPGAGYITVRSSTPDAALPGAGVRILPSDAHLLAKLRSPNTMSVLTTAPGAHHYRFMFVEFMANVNGAGNIISLGDGSTRQNAMAHVPYEIVFDRVYIHGDPVVGQKRAVSLQSASTSIINSYISDIKAVGQDSQAVCGWNGPGPYLLANNFLEAAGENILFGGADPAIAGLVPSDITIVANHLFKPPSWRGSQWQVKNLLELKTGQRVVIDRNIIENNWLAAQTGYAILLKSENQDGGAPWTVVQDVTVTNNVIRHVSSAINILGRSTRYPALVANNITFRNNLFYDVSAARYGGNGRLLMINGAIDVTFDHNTVINDGSSTVYAYDQAVTPFQFTNNVMFDNQWGIMGAGAAEGNATVARYFPGSYLVNNVIAGTSGATYPAANFYATNAAAVGFVDFAGGDYRLAQNSPYKNAATDGSDPGVDYAALPHAGVGTGGATPAVPLTPPVAQPAPGPAPAPVAAPAPAPSLPPAATQPAVAANADAPQGLNAFAVGSTVSVQWTRPAAGGDVSQYVLEAGTTPGASNAAAVALSGTTTSFTAHAVPNGVYYVRVRAQTASGLGAPSAEFTLVVGSASNCGAPPAAPTQLQAVTAPLHATVTWAAPAGGCPPTHYVLLAGSATGLSDLAQATVATPALSATAAPGTYYVRVVAVNALGTSAPSDEIAVTLQR